MRFVSILLILVLVAPPAAGAIDSVADAAREDGCGDACGSTTQDSCPPPCACCPCCFTSPVSMPTLVPIPNPPLLPAPGSPHPDDVYALVLCSDVFHVPKSRQA